MCGVVRASEGTAAGGSSTHVLAPSCVRHPPGPRDGDAVPASSVPSSPLTAHEERRRRAWHGRGCKCWRACGCVRAHARGCTPAQETGALTSPPGPASLGPCSRTHCFLDGPPPCAERATRSPPYTEPRTQASSTVTGHSLALRPLTSPEGHEARVRSTEPAGRQHGRVSSATSAGPHFPGRLVGTRSSPRRRRS